MIKLWLKLRKNIHFMTYFVLFYSEADPHILPGELCQVCVKLVNVKKMLNRRRRRCLKLND